MTKVPQVPALEGMSPLGIRPLPLTPQQQDIVDLAIGLGGWKVDPSDPWKRPYSPKDAAMTALEAHGITKDHPDYTFALIAISDRVQAARDNDTPADEEGR